MLDSFDLGSDHLIPGEGWRGKLVGVLKTNKITTVHTRIFPFPNHPVPTSLVISKLVCSPMPLAYGGYPAPFPLPPPQCHFLSGSLVLKYIICTFCVYWMSVNYSFFFLRRYQLLQNFEWVYHNHIYEIIF